MLARLSGQMARAYDNAWRAGRMAAEAKTPERKREWERLEKSWMALAQGFAAAERVSGYLEWQAKRVDPPPDFEWPPNAEGKA